MSLNQQTKKTTFIEIEALGIRIEVIYTNNVINLTKFVNEMPTEYLNLLTKEKLINDSPKVELKLANCDYFLDYFYYTIDNNLEKYKFIITEKPPQECMQDIFCMANDMLDDILASKGMDIAPRPDQERQLRNEVGAYIGQRIWDFCNKKLNEV